MIKIFVVERIGDYRKNRVTSIAEFYYDTKMWPNAWEYRCAVKGNLASITPGETIGLLLGGDTVQPADVENVERLAREIVLRGATVVLVTCHDRRNFLASPDKVLLADRLNVPVVASDRSLYHATVLEKDWFVIYNDQLF